MSPNANEKRKQKTKVIINMGNENEMKDEEGYNRENGE